MPYGHGKVILLGEHSVVHGRPALAVAVERAVEVSFEPLPSGSHTTLHVAPWDVSIDSGPTPCAEHAQLQQALRVARGFYADQRELALSATVRLAGGAGMGSSAALGVAVLRAFDEARDRPQRDDEIYERSLAWERVFHGNPSGVDNAMATYGGVGLFRRGEPLAKVAPHGRIRLLAVDSGARSSTKEMVELVAQQLADDPDRARRLFDEIAELVWEAKRALELGDQRLLGALMSQNHERLRALELSTPELEKMRTTALSAGALGAKVTGAGGGGCLLALVDGDQGREAVRRAMHALDKQVYDVECGT